MQFNDESQLAQWLVEQGVDTSNWGNGRSKRVVDLWHEWRAGEIGFATDPLCRRVAVVRVLVRRDGDLLVEVAQELENGRRRSRLLPPSEKVKGDESPHATARRCLQEELGVPTHRFRLNKNVYRQFQVLDDSPSYPGLPTEYTFYEVEAHVKGLPDGDFWRENAAFAGGDPVRRHQWGWRPSYQIADLAAPGDTPGAQPSAGDRDEADDG